MHTTIDPVKLGETLVKGPVTTANYKEAPTFEPVPLSSTWPQGKALVFVIRRLGCPVCRTTCLLLSSIRPQLDAHGIPLIAVTFQTGDELKAFLDAGFFNGELYLDEARKSYQATETSGIIGFFKLFADLFTKLSPSFRHRLSKTSGNSKGVAPVFSTIAALKDGKIQYEQKYAEDPKIPEILQSLGVEGEDYKAALESLEMNLQANGDALVGPACSLQSRTVA